MEQEKSSRGWLKRVVGGLGCVVLLACEPSTVAPPPPAQVPVTSEVLEAGRFQAGLRLLGRVEPSARVELVTRSDGQIQYASRFSQGLRTGEKVRIGEPLFTLTNDEVKLRLAEAKLTAEAAESELSRARRGVDGGVLPQAELTRRQIDADLAQERLRNAEGNMERLQYRAPVGGVLSVVNPVPANTELLAGQPVVEILGDGPLQVEAWAASRDLDQLTAGLDVLCIVAGSKTVAGRGKVQQVARQVDQAGTVRLVVTITEDEGMPPVGEGVEVEVLMTPKENVIAVPQEAIRVDGGVSSVFILEPSGSSSKAQLRLVFTGGSSGGRVEILDGVAAGEKIAVQGIELLADGVLAADTTQKGDE